MSITLTSFGYSLPDISFTVLLLSTYLCLWLWSVCLVSLHLSLSNFWLECLIHLHLMQFLPSDLCLQVCYLYLLCFLSFCFPIPPLLFCFVLIRYFLVYHYKLPKVTIFVRLLVFKAIPEWGRMLGIGQVRIPQTWLSN